MTQKFQKGMHNSARRLATIKRCYYWGENKSFEYNIWNKKKLKQNEISFFNFFQPKL